jgi:hypothetical protein
MARILSRLTGSGSGGEWVPGTTSPPADRAKETNFLTPVKYNLELLCAGILGMNRFAGGGDIELDGSTAGTYDLRPMMSMGVDNRNNQISGFSDANSATIVIQFRFYLWSSNSALTLTPAVYNVTQSATATTATPVACSAGSEDYSGTSQQQTITLSLYNGFCYYKPQVILAGTPARGYRWRAYAQFDAYMSLP